MKQGDILVSEYNVEKKILGICGEVIFLSMDNDFTRATNGVFTELGLVKMGWVVKGTEPEDERKARELLQSRGRIVDGKVVK